MPEAGPPPGSHALLIGVPEYEHPEFPQVPAARTSVRAMRDLLLDGALCGWGEHQVTVVDRVSSPADLALRVADVAEATTGTLLLYYVGHGMLSPAGDLCLVMPRTRPDRPMITGLAWTHVAEALRLSPAKTRITILDCCFAGRAIEFLTTGGQALAHLADVQGVYTLTATTRNRTAHVPPPEEQGSRPTSFTGELCDLLRTGIPGKPAWLTLNDIYPVLRARLQEKGLPLPNQRGTDTAGAVVLARNAAPAPARTEPTISGNTPLLDADTPFEERVDAVVAAWASRGRGRDWLVSGTAFFALYLWWHDTRHHARGGDDLTRAYVDACHASIGGSHGWDALLRTRVRCRCHGERWRMENIRICLGCLRYQCLDVDGTQCTACGGHLVG
ncbi:caspase domain-containing protein [Kitasatospora sp. NPDC048365]|uniref:caspase family protein n=1 Tax=Kitasatospora sp. NPDC048365 TaxID=3364050 RepID=UPI0037156D69